MGAKARKKVTVVGAGNVGAAAAQRIFQKELADVVLVDVVEGLPQGKALDLMQTGPIEGCDATIIGSNGYDESAGSDVVLITAGIARKPGMSRSDLLKTNAGIVAKVVREVAPRSPECTIVVVSNPLDVMTFLARRESGFPDARVVGMAGVLDSARFRTFIAMELGVSVKDVDAMVLGGHGDTMVPVPRYCTVNGIPITKLMAPDRIEALSRRTRDGGAEIVGLLKTGSAFYAPGASSAAMIQSILRDENRILPCCTRVRGLWGLEDDWVGVPCRLGRGGVTEVVRLDLDEAEAAALRESARKVREDIALL